MTLNFNQHSLMHLFLKHARYGVYVYGQRHFCQHVSTQDETAISLNYDDYWP